MDPHEPFLKAILASRHDDLPRLVYADWLEESGDPGNTARAHFIRTQIHLETTDPRSDLFHEMKALEGRLLEMYLDEWRFELPEQVRFGSELENVTWRRGFADDLGPMTANDFRTFGAAAIRDLPLTGVRFRERTNRIPFDHYPALTEVTRLALVGYQLLTRTPPHEHLSTQITHSLMITRVFRSLRHLDLSENLITDAWLVAFAAVFPNASFAATLESLDLSSNFQITDAGANVLATAAGLDGLKSLRVRDTGITTAGMSMLKKRFGDRVR